eukprot:CAMPEP_0173338142 /NCGR_PEP_ID=MMETSP1144-20121109/7600_1 /TAXON_ID=483371 /ORGANISM="non described non described, Strain CCMP2298" /LENGTH=176 /DNA_ID=CAMNT_0014283817 /DNA_START=500 /DNA_END=1026 /DNA_ORIENTATION=-
MPIEDQLTRLCLRLCLRVRLLPCLPLPLPLAQPLGLLYVQLAHQGLHLGLNNQFAARVCVSVCVCVCVCVGDVCVCVCVCVCGASTSSIRLLNASAISSRRRWKLDKPLLRKSGETVTAGRVDSEASEEVEIKGGLPDLLEDRLRELIIGREVLALVSPDSQRVGANILLACGRCP